MIQLYQTEYRNFESNAILWHFKLLNNMIIILCSSMQSPPPLEAPLKLIEKDPNAKDVQWDDEGVLDPPIDLF